MPLRRLWAGIPLAVLVALLAHVAAFGADHLPGTDHAGALALAVTLALAAACAAVLVGALRTPPLHLRGASYAEAAGAGVTLAALAAGAFAAIELGEGHGIFAGGLPSFLALLPIAFLVATLARRAEALAQRAGCRLAIYLRRRPARAHIALAVRAGTLARIRAAVARRTLRGRAPPRFA